MSKDESKIMGDMASINNTNGFNQESTSLQNISLNTHKAGMEGLDADKINAIIKNASKGSQFYNHKLKCQERINEKLEALKQMRDSFSQDEILHATKQMDRLAVSLENTRDLSHTIVHVDMDMFYAAVEMRDNPDLRNVPMAVGSTGMLCTSNYAARKYGVRAAMPGFIAKKLCPSLKIIKPDMSKYKLVSKDVHAVFEEYDPNFSAMSLDEAYLDITDYMSKLPTDAEDGTDDECILAEKIVQEIREKIHTKTGLTASAGIASNARLAKVGSDLNKPNGQYYLPPDVTEIKKFIKDLPIRKISGIGNVSEQQLNALNIHKCQDLWEHRGLLYLLFSEISYNSFIRIALGLGETELGCYTERDRKSISTETTFKGTADKKTLFSICEELSKDLSLDLSKKNICGKVITLKIKTVDFEVKTRAQTLSEYTSDESIIQSIAHKLLQGEMDLCSKIKPLSLRLIGVRMSTLVDKDSIKGKKQKTLTEIFSHSKATSNYDENHSPKKRFSNDTDVSVVLTGVESESSNIKDCTSNESNYDSSSGLQIYTCPICTNKISNVNLLQFNKHVDACLINNENIDQNKDLIHPDGDTASTSSDSPGKVSKIDFKGAAYKPDCVQSYTCPVCNTKSFLSMIDLDRHIDECLNIQSLCNLPSPSKNSKKSNSVCLKKQDCQTSLLNYFSTKK